MYIPSILGSWITFSLATKFDAIPSHANRIYGILGDGWYHCKSTTNNRKERKEKSLISQGKALQNLSAISNLVYLIFLP